MDPLAQQQADSGDYEVPDSGTFVAETRKSSLGRDHTAYTLSYSRAFPNAVWHF